MRGKFVVSSLVRDGLVALREDPVRSHIVARDVGTFRKVDNMYPDL